jgi:hypothetical protein
MATPDVFDMDVSRIERLRVRAARREGRGETLVIRFGGEPIAEIGAEFPLDVLEPFADVNLDLALLIRQAIDLSQAEDQTAQLSTLDMLVSVLAANPQLPREFIGAVQEAGRRLLGVDGYAKLVAQRPSPWDVAALLKHLMNWHGVSLGESSSSSTPSAGGGTLKPISSNISGLTSAVPGESPAIPDTSAYAVSSP